MSNIFFPLSIGFSGLALLSAQAFGVTTTINAQDYFTGAGDNTIICGDYYDAGCNGVRFRSNVDNATETVTDFRVFSENTTNFDADPNKVVPGTFTFSPRAFEAPDQYDTDWHGPFENTLENYFFAGFDVEGVYMVSIDIWASDFAQFGDNAPGDTAGAVFRAFQQIGGVDLGAGDDILLDTITSADLFEGDPAETLILMSLATDIDYVLLTIPDGNIYLDHFVFKTRVDAPAALGFMTLGLIGAGFAINRRQKA